VSLGPCPSCGSGFEPLAPGEGDRCSKCGSVLLRDADLPATARERVAGFVLSGTRSRECPACPGKLRRHRHGSLEIERCESCWALFLEPGEALPRESAARAKALFALSLPERAVRTLLGSAGAAAREISSVLVPPAVRQTRFWSSAVDRSLKLLAEGIGRVPAKDADSATVDVARMAVGSVVDTAALLLLHVSPLWLLAVVHDLAKGSRRYLDEVVLDLKARGILSKDESVEGVDQLLSVLERTSRQLHADVDLPPLSVAELRRSAERIRESIAPEDAAEAPPPIPPDAARLAAELEDASRREGRSLQEISSAVVVGAMSGARLAGHAARSGVDVAGRLLVERGWKPYLEQLRVVRRVGFSRYLAAAAKPIAAGVARSFDPASDTLTAQLVSGRLWRQAIELLGRSERA
jgi:hypothetical protein